MESLNLTLKVDKNDPTKKFQVKISDKGEIEMSKEEMLQIIQSQRKEMRYLSTKCQTLTEEKEYLIENFQMSTQVLLERIKDLEAQ